MKPEDLDQLPCFTGEALPNAIYSTKGPYIDPKQALLDAIKELQEWKNGKPMPARELQYEPIPMWLYELIKEAEKNPPVEPKPVTIDDVFAEQMALGRSKSQIAHMLCEYGVDVEKVIDYLERTEEKPTL